MNRYHSLVLTSILAGPAAAQLPALPPSAQTPPPVACGQEAYARLAAATKADNDKLRANQASMSSIEDRQSVPVVNGAGGAVVTKGGLAAAVSLSDAAIIMGNELRIRQYEEAFEIIDEAEHRSTAELAAGLNEKNQHLFRTTRVINKYYPNPGHPHAMKEVARAVLSAVASGGFCRQDGSLAVAGDFRDVVAKELAKSR